MAESTKEQIKEELGDMYRRMRDPEEQEKRDLQVKEKHHAEHTAKRYGLD